MKAVSVLDEIYGTEQKKDLENSLSPCNYGGGAGNRTPDTTDMRFSASPTCFLNKSEIDNLVNCLLRRNEVHIYDVGKGATHYLIKYVTKELCGWNIKIRQRMNARNWPLGGLS
jgi:hypothetical protein